MYDGPTAAAEAAMMALSCTKRKSKVLLSETLLPQVREVVRTYAGYHGIEIGMIAQKDGQTSAEALAEALEGGISTPAQPTQSTTSSIYTVKVTANCLNIRRGPGTNYGISSQIRDKGVYTIIETRGNWGRLKSGRGWICLDYTKKC